MTRQKIKKPNWQQFPCQQAAACASSQGCLRTQPQRLRPTESLPCRAGLPETPLVPRGWLLDVGWLHPTGEVLRFGVPHSSSGPDLVPASSSPALLVLPTLLSSCPSCRPGQGLGLGSSSGAAVSPHGVLRPFQGSAVWCPGSTASVDLHPSTWICWEFQRKIPPASALPFLHPRMQRVRMHREGHTAKLPPASHKPGVLCLLVTLSVPVSQ